MRFSTLVVQRRRVVLLDMRTSAGTQTRFSWTGKRHNQRSEDWFEKESLKLKRSEAEPRGSPKTGHRGSLQNRPTITIIQDVDFGARAATLGRCEQCLERGKEAASHSIWAARLVAAQDPEDHRCPPRNRR